MATLTQLRRIPTPRSEPPYDDEPTTRPRPRSGPPWVQGSLALQLPSFVPATNPFAARTPLRLVPAPPDDEPHTVPYDDEEEPDQRPAPAVHHPWLSRLVQALLEALTGERPHGQLLPWTSDDVFDAVERRALAIRRRRPNVDVTRHAPLRVRTVRVSHPRPDVAEVCALVHRGPRTQAVAFRLEAWRGRWRCTAFEVA